MRDRNNYTSDSSNSGGIGLVGLLTIVFIVLKLLNKIDWSWWWVLSPIWISLGVILLAFAIIVIDALIYYVIKYR